MASLLNSYCCIVDGCKYRKVGGWSVCDPTKKMKTIQVVLKKGDLRTCITKKTISKSCRSQTNQANRKKKKQSGRVDLQTITILQLLLLQIFQGKILWKLSWNCFLVLKHIYMCKLFPYIFLKITLRFWLWVSECFYK